MNYHFLFATLVKFKPHGKGYEQVKGVCLRIAYTLKNPVQLTALSTKPEFAVNKKGAFRTDVYRIRLPDFDRIAYTLGEEVTVTIQNTLFRFTDEEMLAWIGAFGDVTSRPRGVPGFEGTVTDDYEVDVKLSNHIPEILPMSGKRVHVTYPGQPKLCRTCLCQGHIAKDCPDQSKTDFLDYVARLLKSGLFKEELFGSWIDSLKKFHHEFNRPNPNDLRQVMNFNQRGLQRHDLRRNIGYSTNQDLRTRIGQNQEEYYQPDFNQAPNYPLPQQNSQGYQGNQQHQGYQGQSHSNNFYRGQRQYRGNQRGRSRGQGNRGTRRGYSGPYY